MGQSDWTVLRTELLGTGGFGEVFAALGPAGERLAAKVMPKAAGSSRDLLAETIPASPHIVPVLHVEETEKEVILFMPRATRSLREKMTDGPVGLEEATDILTQIAQGLSDLSEGLVHRDLKPENVLLLDGSWAICDFGVARYVDASTAPDTKKFSMTWQYAAPEQWRGERATPASDVYAFGVIAYELVSGERPFEGPDRYDYYEQHLNQVPTSLAAPQRLASLIDECLYKAPGARPQVANLVPRLQRAGADASSSGARALAGAQAAVVAAQAAAHAAAETARSRAEQRVLLHDAAQRLFETIASELVTYIQDAAPAVNIANSNGLRELTLGQARMRITGPLFVRYPTQPWDVISEGDIYLDDLAGGLSRQHSLYYTDFGIPGVFSWYELGFSSWPPNFEHEPSGTNATAGVRVLASPAFGSTQLGYGVIPLDPGNLDTFVELWAERFGNTAVGRFPRVTQLPDRATSQPARR